jgi:long-chain acyl-CoA synthetase
MEYASIIDAWKARVRRSPDRAALRYFDGVMTAGEVDRASDALAVALADRGTQRGDRVAIYLQNVPQYVLVLLAIWKLGAVALPVNPMYRRAELRRLIDDSAAIGIICADTTVPETMETLCDSSVLWFMSTSVLDLQSRNDPRIFEGVERVPPAPDGDVMVLVGRYEGAQPTEIEIQSDEIALLVYTSGTTGRPKGAENTHGNVLNVAVNFGEWAHLCPGDVVFALAPLFHITGAVINAVVSLLTDTTLIFTGRFNADVVLEAFAEHQVTYTISSITVFNAILELPHAGPAHFSSVKALYSGGAPIPPATVDRFRRRCGVYIHNAYGMTETSSGVIAVPLGAEAPVHGPSGTLSIGVPLPNLFARIVNAEGEAVQPGAEGELELSGPQVIAGYWHNDEATRQTMPGGRLRTGDVAIMDESGWVYLVDRLKDLINVSGFKVWPREVEDVLYEHPSVLEAAVVGEPDEYRGETVVAYVSLKNGAVANESELVDFAKERLAAYKYPRIVHVIDHLPKTLTGKIRRRELRESRGNYTGELSS